MAIMETPYGDFDDTFLNEAQIARKKQRTAENRAARYKKALAKLRKQLKGQQNEQGSSDSAT